MTQEEKRTHVLAGIGAFVAGICFASVTIAETRIDEAVRLSKLTLSAIECSILAPDKADAQRLAEVGLASGKKYFDAVAKLSEEEEKIASKDIPTMWKGVSGISPDFVLGRVWQKMENIVHKSLGGDTSKWAREKAKKYVDKNCMSIR
jgi:hypothetical protein